MEGDNKSHSMFFGVVEYGGVVDLEARRDLVQSNASRAFETFPREVQFSLRYSGALYACLICLGGENSDSWA